MNAMRRKRLVSTLEAKAARMETHQEKLATLMEAIRALGCPKCEKNSLDYEITDYGARVYCTRNLCGWK